MNKALLIASGAAALIGIILYSVNWYNLWPSSWIFIPIFWGVAVALVAANFSRNPVTVLLAFTVTAITFILLLNFGLLFGGR